LLCPLGHGESSLLSRSIGFELENVKHTHVHTLDVTVKIIIPSKI
jgi:hypothetical protein